MPPLRYEVVHQLKRDFGALSIVLNGGLGDYDAMEREIRHIDGVMLGRVAYHDPYRLAQADWRLFGDETPVRSRAEVLHAMAAYARVQTAHGTSLRAITRHMLGLYHGQANGRLFRRILSDPLRPANGNLPVLDQALAAVDPGAAETRMPAVV